MKIDKTSKNLSPVRRNRLRLQVALFFWFTGSMVGMAQQLPGSADAGRVLTQDKGKRFIASPPAKVSETTLLPHMEVPQEASSITAYLSDVNLEGMTVFEQSELAYIYRPYVHSEITLDVIWTIAEQVTRHYRSRGYFLSRAYVPAQEIESGKVTIRVVEGYIGDIHIEVPETERHFVENTMDGLTSVRPLAASVLENYLVKLNRIPGLSVQSLLKIQEDAPVGAAKLILKFSSRPGKGTVTLNNYGSRYLGPYQAALNYSDSLLPLQQTTVSVSSTLPPDELKYASAHHEVMLSSEWSVEASGSYVASKPGYTLQPNDINGESVELDVGLRYQPIDQRTEQLAFSLKFSGRNTRNDILGNTPLSTDHFRALRTALHYNALDGWNGYQSLDLQLIQGLEILGSSREGDANLSRSEAKPDATILGMSHMRVQPLGSDVSMVTQIGGQIASGPLVSAEEFGIGGQEFGRAYDPSEFTGDHGLAGSVELRYSGLKPVFNTNLNPYIYYDIGKVWNEDSGKEALSAASAGFGVRIYGRAGVSAHTGLAWPLTRSITTPIHGNGKNPRFLMQVGYNF